MPTNGESCDVCYGQEPSSRHSHYLDLARWRGLDGAMDHVRDHLHARYPYDAERARRYAAEVQEWIKGQMETYSYVVDDHTGGMLPWWEGRQRTIQAMHENYERRRKEAELAQQEAQIRQEVEGFSRVQMPDPTPMREPGEE